MLLKTFPFILFTLLGFSNIKGQENKSITVEGMTVSWHHEHDRIHFTMEAPTTGWLAIGFNTSQNLSDTYLIMGRVQHNKTEVVEHYVIKPGVYQPIIELEGKPQVRDIKGSESNEISVISFSLPHDPACSFQKALNKNTPYHLLVAFSREDDFTHHSMMRTTTQIIL